MYKFYLVKGLSHPYQHYVLFINPIVVASYHRSIHAKKRPPRRVTFVGLEKLHVNWQKDYSIKAPLFCFLLNNHLLSI